MGTSDYGNKDHEINIGIIILNYLAYEETINCTNDFLKQKSDNMLNIKIIIVDNHSQNESYPILCKEFSNNPVTEIVRTKKNLGYARGNNYGYKKLLKYMTPDFVIVSNEDVRIEKDNLFDWVLSCYEKYKFGILGPSIYAERQKYFQSPMENYSTNIMKCEANLWQLKYRRTLYQKTTDNQDVKQYIAKCDSPYYKTSCFDKTLQGSFLVFSRNYFREYKEPFYPKTFLYMEEDFLRLRCTVRQLFMVYDQSFEVSHLQEASTNEFVANEFANEKKALLKIDNSIKSLRNYIQELRHIKRTIKNKEAGLLFQEEEQEHLSVYIKRKQKIFIYGAGRIGKSCLYRLKRKKKKILGFVVSDSEKKSDSEQYPIYSLSEILPLEPNTGIIVAVGNAYRNEIVSILETAGITDYFIY